MSTSSQSIFFRSPEAFIKQHQHSNNYAGSRVNTVIYKQVICLDVRVSHLWIMSWAIWPWIQDLDISNLFVKTLNETFFARILRDSRQIF